MNFGSYNQIYWVKGISSPRVIWKVCLVAINMDTVFRVHQKVSRPNLSGIQQMVFNFRCGGKKNFTNVSRLYHMGMFKEYVFGGKSNYWEWTNDTENRKNPWFQIWTFQTFASDEIQKCTCWFIFKLFLSASLKHFTP